VGSDLADIRDRLDDRGLSGAVLTHQEGDGPVEREAVLGDVPHRGDGEGPLRLRPMVQPNAPYKHGDAPWPAAVTSQEGARNRTRVPLPAALQGPGGPTPPRAVRPAGRRPAALRAGPRG